MQDNKEFVNETLELFTAFDTPNRQLWVTAAREDEEFRYGRQWTDSQIAELNERGQAAIVINRIHPAVEAAKAMLTANNPTFRVAPTEDSDNKTAHALNGLIQYIWNISEGNRQFSQMVDKYFVRGLGALMPYIDQIADGGRGEIKIREIEPFDIYIDPNSRDAFASDASDIIISREFTKGQLKRLYPMYQKAIDNANGRPKSDMISTGNVDGGETIGAIYFPGQDFAGDYDGDYVRAYERYTKIWTNMFRVYEEFSKQEFDMSDAQFSEYMKKKVWIIEGNIQKEEFLAQKMAKGVVSAYEYALKQYEEALQLAEQNEEYAAALAEGQIQPPQEPQIEESRIEELFELGLIKAVSVPKQRIRMAVVVGDQLLYQRILPCEEYPIVLVMNMHTGTPYPLSDVRMVKDMQRYINKVRSLIVAHATASTNVKLLVPKGTDVEQLKKLWAQPNAIIDVDFSDGVPVPVQPLPMPNELYQNELTAKQDIDHQLGLYESMMGNSAAAPDTYRGIMMMDEFGQRKIRSKQSHIEVALQRLGTVLVPFIQEFYTVEKQFRILNPNNSMSEYAINKGLYDDYGSLIGKLNDVSVGKYDVIVVTGSTLPSNRYGQFDFYLDAYKNQIIDRVEVLKKSDIFDMEGVLQRIDTIEQLQLQIEQMGRQIKELSGDLQTRERELFHANMRADLAQAKTQLDGELLKTKNREELYRARLDDSLNMTAQKASLEISKATSNIKQRAGRKNNQQRN